LKDSFERYSHSIFSVSDLLFLFGGFNSNYKLDSQLYHLDLDQKRISKITTGNEKSNGKFNFSSVVISDDFYIFGGIEKSKNGKLQRTNEIIKLITGYNFTGKKKISHYIDLEKTLGEGNQAKVMKVLDSRNKKEYALKKIKITSNSDGIQIIDPINQEIEILKSISHENIISIHESFMFEENSNWYFALVSEYCNKGHLLDFIKKSKLKEIELIEIIHQIIDGIQNLHSKKIMHRDIKPENILLNEIESKLSVKIADFGLATTSTLANGFVGTLAYMVQ
jgi:tRNA A-37 threonylcarbamoyl transferase component Bud32